MEPKVSIIIPVYNTSEYLQDCFDSILKQSYPSWECIIVDDGSTDSSWSICEAWSKKDRRFKALHKSNGGQSSARNLALDHVTGDYITFLDSDDYYDNNLLLERLVEILIADNTIDIIQYSLKACFESGELSFLSQPACDIFLTNRKEILRAFANKQISTIVTEKIFKRSIITKSFRFPEGVYYEDECFLIDVLQQSHNFFITKVGYYHYRLRNGSTTHQDFDLRHTMDLFKKDFHGMKMAKNYSYLDHLYMEYFKGAFNEYKNAQLISDTEVLSEYKKELVSYSPSWSNIFNDKYNLSLSDKITTIIVKLTGFSLLNSLIKLKKKCKRATIYGL